MSRRKEALAPIRHQYLGIKRQYPQAIVLFRLGDFYETFDEDAEVVSRELDIVLTSREMGKGQRFPMAGIPHHALNSYLAKLISSGHKVAICEQVSEPTGRGLVQREVVRVVTPGTVVEPELLELKANNYLVSVAPGEEGAGVAYIDITTGEFGTTQLASDRLQPELERLLPAEVLLPQSCSFPDSSFATPATRLDDRWFELETAQEALLQHFEAASLEGYGCAHLPLAVQAAGAIIHYLSETQKGALSQVGALSTYTTESFMLLDPQTRRNLELFQSSRFGLSSGSLLALIDLTRTPMGARLLRRWLGQPLLDINEIGNRQNAVEWFLHNTVSRAETISTLGRIADLERLIGRVRAGIVTPRELVSLRRSLEVVPQLKAILEAESAPSWLSAELKPCDEVVALLSQAIADEPPPANEGGVIKPGFSAELDGIRSASKEAKQFLADLERKERERTGIKSLKVGYNKVFGYYIEVTSPHLKRVPPDYIRKQTLVGAERFFTEELKEYESLILNAEERIAELEGTLFRQVCQQVAAWGQRILDTASALAQIDVLAALAEVAARYGYIRPKLTDDDAIEIQAGRHPVVERVLLEGSFVPNDVYLANHDCQLIVLTGPNMSGKSTYLRQVALIVLLAQIGSFVPADAAIIGVVDRIFTRVGLVDEIATGRSTFMVEMVETANILNNATSKSLIILDEIGRGTSTYDGLSIARAVAEYIHNHPRLGAKTLFATHYHELVELAEYLPRVRNFNVAVSEEGGKVVFLRKIVPGGADKSYGIHVAQLAGLPRTVLSRAEDILTELEGGDYEGRRARRARRGRRAPQGEQLPLLAPKSSILEELEGLDIFSMSPLEALSKLYELQQKAKEE